MARVFFSATLQRSTGGVEEWEVPASSMRDLATRLHQRFPALSEQLKSAAVSIDGDVVPGAWLEELEPDSEVHFLPALSGG